VQAERLPTPQPEVEPSFADLLREHRLAAKLTQAALAERAGISMRGLNALERGTSQPHRDTLDRLQSALGLTPEQQAVLRAAAQPTPRRRATSAPDSNHQRHNLPIQTTSFVVRAHELSQLRERLDASRLVTITGAGGCGKTRLALEIAAERVVQFPDGVWFVELAPLADASLVPQTIAVTLGIHAAGRQPADVLVEFLLRRQVLLVLDNCEHVIEACALLVEQLLRSCAGLRVLATSRERLDVPGEAVQQVGGLALPAAGASVADIARSEAGQLLLERARRLVPDLTLDASGAEALVRICRRLDGIPLPIELAAAAARALSLEDLADRLEDRFRLLRAAGRTAPPRHQTLRATMDWSYQLLTPEEAVLFRRLAVFAGGWELAALEAVHGPDALQPLLRLIDKSLVVVQRRGRAQRYDMLETIRQYAEEKLIDSGEAAEVRERHRDYYVVVAEDAVAGLRGPQQVEWVEHLETEHDNLRAALAWCQVDPEGADKEERLAGGLGRFWRDRGYTQEGFGWLMHAAERRPDAVSVGRGRALQWAAIIAQHADLVHEQQAALLEQSVRVLRRAGDPVELSLALRHLWSNSSYGPRGTPQRDTRLLDESLAIARAAGDRRETGWGLLYLAQVALDRGDSAEARRLADEALPFVRGLDPNSLLTALLQSGRVALAQGEPAHAEVVFREMVDRSYAIGDRLWLCDGWLGLAGAVRARGDYSGARECFCELVADLRATSLGYMLPRVVLGLAILEAGCGDESTAARLLGAFEASGSTPTGWPLDHYHLGPKLAQLRTRLQSATALVDGRVLTIDQALDEALDAPGC
jgi:non-specific serine/threonine protein kinase